MPEQVSHLLAPGAPMQLLVRCVLSRPVHFNIFAVLGTKAPKVLLCSKLVAAVSLARTPLRRVDQWARLGQSPWWSIGMWRLPRLSFALSEGFFMTMRLLLRVGFKVEGLLKKSPL